MTIHAMEKRQHFKSFRTYAVHKIIVSGNLMFLHVVNGSDRYFARYFAST